VGTVYVFYKDRRDKIGLEEPVNVGLFCYESYLDEAKKDLVQKNKSGTIREVP